MLKFKRGIIAPAVVALGTAGTVVGGVAVSLAATSAPAVVAAAPAHSAHPSWVYNG
jgi:hypothetical protein